MTEPAQTAAPEAASSQRGWARIRHAIESRLEAWGHVVYRNAWLVIVATLMIVAGLASQLPTLTMDTSSEGFLAEDDPVRLAYDDFRRQFGRDDVIVPAVSGPDIFALPFLEKLRALHTALEDQVPKLEEVTSLINARDTRGVGDELHVGDLLEDWPSNAEQLATIRERALANPLYRDQIISSSGRLTTVLIETDAYSSTETTAEALSGFDDFELDAAGGSDAASERDAASGSDARGGSEAGGEAPFLTGQENSEIIAAVREVMAAHDAPDFRLYAAGTPFMMDEIMRGMTADMGVFAALALVAMAGFLYFLFRSLAAVLLGMVASVLAVLSSVSTMAILGMSLTSPTQIMPSFLLAVGVGNSVHVLVIYFQSRGRGLDAEGAIAHALGHSGLAIVMTALTTAGGLLSFTTAEIAPVADVGIICPIGALIALAFSLVLLPALIAVIPMDGAVRKGWGTGTGLRALPVRLGQLGTTRPWTVTGIWALLLAAAITGALQLRFSHHPIQWFQPDHPLRISTELINDELKGSIFLEAVVDTGRVNGLKDPDMLRRLDAMQRHAEAVDVGVLDIERTLSLADVTKEIHQALNENRPEFHALPQTPELVAQELLLFENSGSDDLEDFADSQFQLGRVTLKLPMVDAVGFDDLFLALEPEFRRILGEKATVTVTGHWSILGRTVNALMHSLAKTYVMAFATITPLMILLLASIRLGLVSMIPNLAAIVMTVGGMGWLGVPMDAFTLMVGSIALGLAVDDTIHFMHNYRRALSQTGDPAASVRTTLESTGQALLFTSLVLSTGFFIYIFASMANLYSFGLLTAIAIGLAFLANVTLSPALVTLLARWDRRRHHTDSASPAIGDVAELG